MYTLYGYKASGSVAIECALTLIGAPYGFVRAASWDETSELAKLRAVNPLLQIPVLVLADGTAITESAAILIHLGLAHPQAKLLPSSPSARAKAIQGLVYIAANGYSAVGVIDFPQRWLPQEDETARSKLKAGAIRRFHESWEAFADQFTPSPYLSGEHLGSLDLLAVVVSKWDGAREHLRRARPAFADLMERIEAQPQIQAVFARHFTSGAS